MADCSQLLPNDVWRFIGKKLPLTLDRIRFRSVCRRWRTLLPLPQPPWLMLAQDERTPTTRGFFGLGRQQPNGADEEEDDQSKVYQFELPEVYRTRCLGSKGTWLITIDPQQRVRLINPFSRFQFDLPSLLTLEYAPKLTYKVEHQILADAFIWKLVLSSPPSDQDCIAMAIHHFEKRLAIARPGDASWTAIETPRLGIQDAVFYKHQIYAINYKGILMVCDVGGDDQTPPKATRLSAGFKKFVETNKLYLVEWMGELLLIVRIMHGEGNFENYYLSTFEVYILDSIDMRWRELENLGEYSLFLGFNTSVAVFASHFPGLKKNCIYYTDDYLIGYLVMELKKNGSDYVDDDDYLFEFPAGCDMGIFNLEDETITPHYKGVSTSFCSPPLWIIP